MDEQQTLLSTIITSSTNHKKHKYRQPDLKAQLFPPDDEQQIEKLQKDQDIDQDKNKDKDKDQENPDRVLCQRDRIIARSYADYYYSMSDMYSALFWVFNGTVSLLLIAAGIFGLNTTNKYIQYVCKAIPIVIGIAVPFVGKVDLSGRSTACEKAGDVYKRLSNGFAKQAEKGPDKRIVETLQAQQDQYSDEYDEPPQSYLRRRKRQVTEMFKEEIGGHRSWYCRIHLLLFEHMAESYHHR